jgi:hypothetical protein
VLKALLDRYVGEDLLYHAPDRFLVPRFLLNDIARYWRTMAVDSAQKRHDRVDGWALRNIKLRPALRQVHISEIDAAGHHERLSMTTILSSRKIASFIGADIPIVIESRIIAEDLDREIDAVESALTLVATRPSTAETVDWGELA